MGCGTSVSSLFLGFFVVFFFLLDKRLYVFLIKKMSPQVTVNRTNTVLNYFVLTGSVFTCLTVALGFYRLWI